MILRTLALTTAMLFGINSHAAGEQKLDHSEAQAKILSLYTQIQEKLASDSLDGIKEASIEISKLTSDSKVSNASKQLADSQNINAARKSFKALSKPIVKWVEKTKPQDLEIVYCPMAGAKWVQKKGDVKNPYMGKQMLECGKKAS